MRFAAARQDLLRAADAVARVVERRNTIPILSNLKLAAEGTTLTLTGTDLDVEIRVLCPAEVAEPGVVTVPAATLAAYLHKLPDRAEVSFATEPGSHAATVKAGRGRATLQTLPETDFPDLAKDFAEAHAFTITGKELLRLFESVAFAISTEETRYYLNGIHLRPADGASGPELHAAATDGHRLGRVAMELPDGAAGMPGIIVPKKAVAELTRMAKAADAGEIAIAVSRVKIQAEHERTRFVSKLIDGTFPDYERVIPRGNDRVVTCNGADLARAIDRVSTVSSERGRAVKLTFGGGRIGLGMNSPDAGSAADEVDATYDGPEIVVGMNGRYAADILAQLGSGPIEIALSDPGAPMLWRQPEREAERLYVLMPMRV